MSLKPTFRPVLLVFFRLLKCYQNGGSFCCDVQLCNRTRRIVIITRCANDVKVRGKINAGLSSNFFFFLRFLIIYRPLQFLSRSKKEFRIGFQGSTWSKLLRTLIP